jgi:hypothetical protein
MMNDFPSTHFAVADLGSEGDGTVDQQVVRHGRYLAPAPQRVRRAVARSHDAQTRPDRRLRGSVAASIAESVKFLELIVIVDDSFVTVANSIC